MSEEQSIHQNQLKSPASIKTLDPHRQTLLQSRLNDYIQVKRQMNQTTHAFKRHVHKGQSL